jgi:hypothetical protein
MLSPLYRALSIARAEHTQNRGALVITDAWRKITPTIEAVTEEPPRQSINSDRNSTRLINTTSAQKDQLQLRSRTMLLSETKHRETRGIGLLDTRGVRRC